MNNVKIQLDKVTMLYTPEKGVFNINININKGQIFGFLGPSGSGKTTLIRIILGFIKQKSGVVKVNDLDVWTNSALNNNTIGYIPGEPIIPNEGTGISFLKFYAKLRNIKDLKKMYQLIEYFELDVKCQIKKMSKGMKQKIAIIACLMGEFDIYILDEPTSGLDPVMQAKFLKTIKELKDDGKTIILSSHIMKEVEELCDQILILKHGHIMFNDTLENIKKSKKTIEQVFWDIYEIQGFQENLKNA